MRQVVVKMRLVDILFGIFILFAFFILLLNCDFSQIIGVPLVVMSLPTLSDVCIAASILALMGLIAVGLLRS